MRFTVHDIVWNLTGRFQGARAGRLAVGQLADVTLWDLSALSMLPRTDPLQLLVLGSRTQASRGDGGGILARACIFSIENHWDINIQGVQK